MKKYRFERTGRRSLDTTLEYDAVTMKAREKTRTITEALVRAICSFPLASAVSYANA